MIKSTVPAFVLFVFFALMSEASDSGAIRFNTNFPGGSLGKIVLIGENVYRCHVVGQYNEEGRNRQTSGFYFRIENCKDREITLIITDYIGEYNNRPGAVAMTANIRPVGSSDDISWTHLENMEWDDERKEATLRFRPTTDVFWIAHVPPYTHSRLLAFLEEIDHSSSVRIEVFGQSVEKRPLHLITVTDPATSDENKLNIWLMARQHAWEAPTSFIAEGALRFLVSDRPEAVELRHQAVFRMIPTLDPDGCDKGGIRFNRNGYDTNRHWSRVDLRSKTDGKNMPEICYALKMFTSAQKEDRAIDLLVSLHNQETGDCLMTAVDEDAAHELMCRFEKRLTAYTFYDSEKPSMPIRFTAPERTNTIEALWRRLRIPTAIVEIRVERHPKLDRYATSQDFIDFGSGLIQSMFAAVKETQ